jgi:hypothetical protein
LVTGQSAGSFSTEDGAVSKTAYIAEGAYTFEMAGTYGDGICCRYGAGEFKTTVSGEPVAISSSGEFRDVVRESFDVVGRSTGPTVDCRLDVAYDDYPYETSGSLQRVSRPVLFTQSESCDSALVLVRLQRGKNVKTSPREEALMVVC